MQDSPALNPGLTNSLTGSNAVQRWAGDMPKLNSSPSLGVAALAAAAVWLLPAPGEAKPAGAAAKQPNVIIVLTDDQGYGDLSCHGNPVLRTPNLDRLRTESVRLTDFHVTPMCTPTRSSLMTGRDCLRTGAYVVCSGHGFIREDIPTMAEVFAAGGYRTGIFGKWHLGDSYPYRPQDRGFQETLVFHGWGIGCANDYWNNAYLDCHFRHNGRVQFYKGYCTDVFFSEAMKWMKACARRNQRFLVYLPVNVPHGPTWVEEKYAAPYEGKVKPSKARFFGMIANLDENMGKLEAMLKESGLYENTLVIFMTDNGGTGGVAIYNAGMRGSKTEYYDGGHRVPCFIRWPAGGLRMPCDVDALTQAQDILPTLMDLCSLGAPTNAAFDGASLAPLLRGHPQPELDSRILVTQYAIWQEFLGPTKWNSAVMQQKWRLVHGNELYDLSADPHQTNNVAAAEPRVVSRLRDYYERWWQEIEPTVRDYNPIHLGSAREKVVCLSSQDWAAYNTSNASDIRQGVNRNGAWHVEVERQGQYEIALRRWPVEADAPIAAAIPAYRGALGEYEAGKALPIAKARLRVGPVDRTKAVKAGDKAAEFTLDLPQGRVELQTWFYEATGGELCGAYYVYVRWKGRARG